MKLPIIAFVLILPAFGGTITVCSSGCNYTTAQDALNASKDGDTIILTAGQNFGDLAIPGGRHDLTIKSSKIDSYPRGYRITRNNPALARLTSVTVGDTGRWGATTPGSSLLTNAPGGAPQAHGLHVGDRVFVGGQAYSAYNCASLNQPPYVDGACDATRVGFLNIRGDTQLSNGSVLYFHGRTLPPPLKVKTPYYVVNFTRGGSPPVADKFQIALTPGGTPIVIPQFDPEGQDMDVEQPPIPLQDGSMYVVSTPTPSTLQLSATVNGPPVVWTQVPYGYNGGGFSIGFSLTKTAPVYNLTFDGIELAPTVDSGVYYPFYVSRSIASLDGEHHDIRVLRCWIHGADDQEDFPITMLNIAGRNLEIGWNIIENAYSTFSDSQDISFESTANVSIHDNEIKGSAEGIFSGGNTPWFALQTNTTGISVYRNYMWKPLKAYGGITGAWVSPTQFQFVNRFAGADCSTAASDPQLGHRCFAYEAQETPGTSTPPSAPVISRTEWTASAADSIFTAPGLNGQLGFIYLLGGAFHMDYNYSGTVSCPAGVICTFVAVPKFPTLSTRIGIVTIGINGANGFDQATFYGGFRNVSSKNEIESKYGDNWLIEGNVFHRQSNCDGGALCQDEAINLTVSVNGSGSSEMVNYLASSSNSIIRNNIFRMMSGGVVMVGKSFPGLYGGVGVNWEIANFGRNEGTRVENNLFMDLGSTEYEPFNDGFILKAQRTQALTFEHNTAVDVKNGFNLDGAQAVIIRSNIATPYRSNCPGVPYCSSPAASSNIGVQDASFLLPSVGGTGSGFWTGDLALGNVDAASRLDNNILMNRMGVCCITSRPANYPLTTWLMEPGDVGRDPNTLFTSWQERDNSVPPNGLNYRNGNYRLAPGQAALYPAYDSKVIGADIDEIEALTGKAGIDVENGWPTFAERTGRTISAGVSTAVIAYLPNGSPCSIKAWPNSFYSGTPAINITDSGAEVLSGRISVTLSGLSPATAYYGKRGCGNEVDVFSLATAASAPTSTIQLSAPGGAAKCVIEYGPTSTLGSTTAATLVSGRTCSVAIPAAAVYWRYAFQSNAGTPVGIGDIQHRAQ